MKQIPNTKRPHRSDDAITQATALELAALVKGSRKDFDNYTIEELTADLGKAIRWGDDGYSIASELDGKGWEPDAALVETMDSCGGIRGKHHEAALKAWLPESGLVAPAIGTAVIGGPAAGMVTKNYEETGQSTVTADGGVYGFGRIVNWEALEVS